MKSKTKTKSTRRCPQAPTGPRTAAGKAASSRNALLDGLYAKATVMLPGEDQADYHALRRGISAQYSPRTPLHHDLVHQMTCTEWRLRRAELIEARRAIDLYAQPTKEAYRAYQRVLQVACTLRRAWFKLYKRLERIHAPRAA